MVGASAVATRSFAISTPIERDRAPAKKDGGFHFDDELKRSSFSNER
jgi:hypothetical protein